MPVDVAKILPAQRDSTLSIQEGHFSDIKSIDIRPAKLTRTISALANADGGELYIGVDADKSLGKRSWRGFNGPEAANGHLQVFEKLFPLGQDFQYTFLACDGEPGLVLQVQIQKTHRITLASDKKPYLRRGAQSLPVQDTESLKRLEYCKGITSFETETVNCDVSVVTNSEVTIGFMLQVIPTAEPENWLKKQQLIRESKPTVAGAVLFADEPQAVLPKRCGIKVYRYRTSKSLGTRETMAFDPITVEGCAYTQIREAIRITTETVEEIKRLGEKGLEEVTYPPEALHEIITNAVLHRDYSIADDVHVRVFENRVEVESPGRLPAHVTVQNILAERFARNGNLVRIINKFPDAPNKDIGEGLNTAFEAMRKLRLKPPIIEERENSVIVFIRHEPLASPEELVMEYLGNHDRINNSAAREICHIGSENVMKRVFERLMKRGMIERVPNLKGRATAYQKVAR